MRAKNFLFLVVACFAVACATSAEKVEYQEAGAPTGSYSDVLEKWTSSEKEYRGASESFNVTSTILATDVVEQQVLMDAEQFHWTIAQYREARQKALYEAQSGTAVFVSFYTEKDESNDLDKSKTIWNIFMDSIGKRISPESIKKVYESKVVLSRKYPYHNVWNKAYLIKFPIATNIATGSDLKLTFAGPVGAATLKYPNQ